MTVWMAIHVNSQDYYGANQTCLGLYSSREKADARIIAAKLAGYEEQTGSYSDLYFVVAEYEIDKDTAWTL